MTTASISMTPVPGERLVRFVGDIITFRLQGGSGFDPDNGCCARLRTTLGRGRQLRAEILHAHFKSLPPAGAAWRDLEMKWVNDAWSISVPLAEVGFFRAKAYLTDNRGWQHWPDGADFGVNVQPDWCRTGNTIYCAFPRMYGPDKSQTQTIDESREERWKKFDQLGYTIIPPSGKLRDLIAEVPHIFDTLGCRILHLLPVSPTPTTFARFGRFGSPYAVQDLTAIDPALVDFDRRTTGIGQFHELTEAVHLRNGKLILDLVINHTGWGSTLFERHPEWFVKDDDGQFVSPGAWGTIWEDLVEIDPASADLWDELAEAFLTWCRRGVDGFRCDAGYKVPVLVWQCITARVHEEFPETVFFLEGLGGGWDDTAIRLTDGGMQWAYSEIFQNYSSPELCGYLDHAWEESARVGLLINYSETHDNDRLAEKGRAWSILRNQLCALTSVCGGFGFTNGVEWLAVEKVNVHSARGLAWGNQPNIINELARLNRLLAGHPCFFDGAQLIRLSKPDDAVFVFVRISSDERHVLMVLANVDPGEERTFCWRKPAGKSDQQLGLVWESALRSNAVDLLSDVVIRPESSDESQVGWKLAPGRVYCLCLDSSCVPEDGRTYRDERARAALAMRAAHAVGREFDYVEQDWRQLSVAVNDDPIAFLARLSSEECGTYLPLVRWTTMDSLRVTLVPPKHWLLISLPERFRIKLMAEDGRPPTHLSAVPSAREWIAAVPPGQLPGDVRLEVETYGKQVFHHAGLIRFLGPEPQWQGELAGAEVVAGLARERTVLLTNGRGGMARINLDLGQVRSKYDCLLGANLHAELPVDRHVFIKRARVWANVNGFISALNADNLSRFQFGPPPVWTFRVPAGGGRRVQVRMQAEMIAGENTVVLVFLRERSEPLDGIRLQLTVRFDLEDRNFHWETKRNGAAEHHFSSHCQKFDEKTGFEFRPDPKRVLSVTATKGDYHAAPEWSERIAHPVEASRGQTGAGDAWSPGWFELPLAEDGASVQLVCTAERRSSADSSTSGVIPMGKMLVQPVIGEVSTGHGNADDFGNQLHRAAAQFIVRRGDFKSVIAGYPWFLDWGRDTLICARGLIAGSWFEEVKQLLIVFGRFEEGGTLPNTIHGNDASNRETSDAPLWYGIVAEELAVATSESVFDLPLDGRRTMREVLGGIAAGFLEGTPNGIRVDRESGLVWSPSHFTWMDTNFPAGTPREGYPIEIQSLWIRLLRLLARLNLPTAGESWGDLAARAMASLEQYYWLPDKGWFADSLIAGPAVCASNAVPDQLLRSNCLIPISLGQLTGDRVRRCVEAVRQYLVVPGAIRTLAPLPAEPPLPIQGNHGGLLNDPANPYWGRYEGDEDTRRKPAYHNGTAWTWMFPIFCEALARAHEESPASIAAARAYLGSTDRLLTEGCVGHLPEIVDGDAPHSQRGCDAQAWSATEALRVWRWLEQRRPK